MPFEVEASGDVQIVHVSGSINSGNSMKFQETLRALIDAGHRHIVLNLEELFYICSMGIGVLAKARNELDELHGRLIIMSPRDDVRRLLSMLRLDRIIPITDTREEALDLCN